MVVVELHFCVDTSLFPECGHGTPDLKMREAIVINEDYLLSFTEVRHMPLVVKASVVVTGSSLFPRSPGD